MRFGDAVIGAVVGFVIVWLPFVVVYPRLRGRVGMGLGDAKLLMLAGAWFGWAGALFVLGAGAVQGTLVAIPILLFRGKLDDPEAVQREREEMKQSSTPVARGARRGREGARRRPRSPRSPARVSARRAWRSAPSWRWPPIECLSSAAIVFGGPRRGSAS